MSDSIPTVEVHPPKQEEDRERGREDGEGEEENSEEVREEEEDYAPAPPLSEELTSTGQLKGEPQPRATEKEDAKIGVRKEQEKEEEKEMVEEEKDGNEEEVEKEIDAAQVAVAAAECDGSDGGSGAEMAKGISKVQSVFALVRSRVRSQGSADRPQGRRILEVVQQATRDLVRAQGSRAAVEPSEEASSGAETGDGRGSLVGMEESKAEGEGTLERVEDLENTGSHRGGAGGDDEGEAARGGRGEEVLRSIEALRQELKMEITQLRLDTQLALAGLEVRLLHSLRTHANPSATASLAMQPAPTQTGSAQGGAEKRPRPPVIVGTATPAGAPSSHGARRRALYRTLTTLTSSTCPPPPPLLPRSRSEPMGGRVSLARRPSNGAAAAERLPPAPTQHAKKPLRSKTRLAKPASG